DVDNRDFPGGSGERPRRPAIVNELAFDSVRRRHPRIGETGCGLDPRGRPVRGEECEFACSCLPPRETQPVARDLETDCGQFRFDKIDRLTVRSISGQPRPKGVQPLQPAPYGRLVRQTTRFVWIIHWRASSLFNATVAAAAAPVNTLPG